MATLAAGGRIGVDVVEEEKARLRAQLATQRSSGPGEELLEAILGAEAADALDQFDAVQLADVLGVCRSSRSLSEAGRTLFARSRRDKRMPNDADRLRKYLARFGLDWTSLRGEMDERA
jgi:transcriptional regulatory protein RtcR